MWRSTRPAVRLARPASLYKVAEEYATVDTVSGGRLVAGFPVGLPYDACLNNGIPPMELRPRFDENLQLILRAWREDTPFAWNGKFSQYSDGQHLAPPAAEASSSSLAHGHRQPGTMQAAFDLDFGFNYLSFFGAEAGARVFGRFWDLADKCGLPRNPYRLGMVQLVGVAGTDDEAARIFRPHVSTCSTRDRARSARRSRPYLEPSAS